MYFKSVSGPPGRRLTSKNSDDGSVISSVKYMMELNINWDSMKSLRTLRLVISLDDSSMIYAPTGLILFVKQFNIN